MLLHTTKWLRRGVAVCGPVGLVFCGLLAACSSGGEDADTDGGGATGGSAASGGSAAVGGTNGGSSAGGATLTGNFQVKLNAASPGAQTEAFTSILGQLFDRPQPSPLVLKLAQEQDGCELLVPEAPFCSPACGSSGVCTAANECTPHARPQDAGPVRVTGLGATDLTLMPTSSSFVYQTTSALPNPACAEGATFGIEAGAFSAQGKCIEQLVLGGPAEVPVMSGRGTALSWTPPKQAGISRVHIKLDVSHHGGSKGEINCDVPDNGAFTIPEKLITALVSLGLAGCPYIDVSRYSTASAANAVGVKLEMTSPLRRAVATSAGCCADDTDCSGGTTCQKDFTCR